MMTTRPSLQLFWENHDNHIFGAAWGLARNLAGSVAGNALQRNKRRQPESARLVLCRVVGHSRDLTYLWQLIKRWPTSRANVPMKDFLKCLREIEVCAKRRERCGKDYCWNHSGRNLRFAGCRWLKPALGPVRLDRPFDPDDTYLGEGVGDGGFWRFDRDKIRGTWEARARHLFLGYCPYYQGYETALSLVPEEVRYGRKAAWRLVQDEWDTRYSFPIDVKVPEGFTEVHPPSSLAE
ncbi:MAG: hypothetical protein JW819_03800 [Candidatus Krumholzibacteriota bacterium]|jgi:hypothetical protein|nr:hypothetical protein [Candidatus Krumholzibacteriota bacterium]